MDICYHKSLLGYNLTKIPNEELYSVLPQGIYTVTVQKNMNGFEYYFTPQKDFHIPDYVVSDLAFIERVRNVYIKSGKQLGILLHGLSGMGKSMLAKQLCMEMVTKCQMPVIIFDFNSAEHIADILKQVNQPSVIFLDEFEKMFANDDVHSKPYQEQNELLSILDGTNVSKHIFLFTANEKTEISPHMFNRPSRIRYCINYTAIPRNVIIQIIDNNVEEQEKREFLYGLTNVVKTLTYDVLFELINEVLYTEELNVNEFLRVFNLESKQVSANDFKVETTFSSTNVPEHIVKKFNECFTGGLEIAFDFQVLLNLDPSNKLGVKFYNNEEIYFNYFKPVQDKSGMISCNGNELIQEGFSQDRAFYPGYYYCRTEKELTYNNLYSDDTIVFYIRPETYYTRGYFNRFGITDKDLNEYINEIEYKFTLTRK